MTSIADTEKWQELTAAWAAKLVHIRSDDHDFKVQVARYARLYPLPVGRQSLRQPWLLWFGNPDMIDGLMPFDGDEFAVCVVIDQVKDTTIEAFGLCRLEGRDDRLRMAYRTTPMQFRLAGPNAAHKDVTARCSELKASWSKHVGIPIRPGRPPGRTITRDDIVDAFRDFEQANGWGPDQSEVAAELSVSTKTIRNVLQEPWPTFARKMSI
jgi:hypothetical protein